MRLGHKYRGAGSGRVIAAKKVLEAPLDKKHGGVRRRPFLHGAGAGFFKSVDEEKKSASCCAKSRRYWRGSWLCVGSAWRKQADYLAPKLQETFLPDPFVLKDMEAGRETGWGRRWWRANVSRCSATMTWMARPPRRCCRIFSLRWARLPARLYSGPHDRGLWPVAGGDARALHVEGASLLITVDCGAPPRTAALEEAKNIGPGRGGAGSSPGRDISAFRGARQFPTNLTIVLAWDIFARPASTFLFSGGAQTGICAPSAFYQDRGIAEPDLRLFLDLVGLATICDVVPLNGVNRAFVRFGLGQIGALVAPRALRHWPVSREQKARSRLITLALSSDRASMPGGRVGRSLAGRGPADDARCGQGDGIRRPAGPAQQGTPGDRKNSSWKRPLPWRRPRPTRLFLLVTGEGWHPGRGSESWRGRLKERFFSKPAFVAGFEGGQTWKYNWTRLGPLDPRHRQSAASSAPRPRPR